MKKFYNTLLAAVASLAFSVSTYADNSGYYSDGAEDLYISYKTSVNGNYQHKYICSGATDINNQGVGCNSSGVASKNLGVCTELYIDRFYANVWKNKSWGNVCSVELHYSNDQFSSNHSYKGNCGQEGKGDSGDNSNVEFYWNSSSSDKSNQTLSGDGGIDIVSLCAGNNRTPGNYRVDYYYDGKFADDGTSNCPDANNRQLKNGGVNYQITFTYPGIILTTKSVKIEEPNGNATVSFTTYGFSGDYVASLTGTGASNFAISDEQAGSLIVTYTGESSSIETATLTITPPDGKGLAVNVPLEGSTGQAPLPLLADTLVLSGNKAKFSGYLKYTGCFDIKDYGFYYCSGQDCEPSTSGTKVVADGCDGEKSLGRGEVFEKTVSGLTYDPATWYGYRAYVIYNKGAGNVTVYSDEVKRFLVNSQCKLPAGDTLFVTVDKKYVDNESLCDMQFGSIESALAQVKGLSDIYADGVFKRHVVMEIDGSTYTTNTEIGGVTGGGKTDAHCHQFHNINNVEDPKKWLILRAKDPVNKPTIQHPSIRNSKKIRFENVRLVGDETKKDNAIDLENGYGDEGGGWFNQPLGDVANSDIQFVSCYIKSWGFTCLHASAYDLVTFENCDFEAELTDVDDNVIAWGASAKFIHCSNIKFLRNNFRGSHATSVWLQGCQKALFMNNVFWNNNLIKDNVAFVRLVSQIGVSDPKLQELAFYYNTMYLANTDVKDEYKVDFFRLGSKYTNSKCGGGLLDSMGEGTIDVSKIAFQYNNCYSYDDDVVTGRKADDDVFLNIGAEPFCERIRNNNFWSAYDEILKPAQSVFNIGCYNNFTNVPSQVCTTGALDPAGLVVKGVKLNTGSRVGADVSGLGAEDMLNDRLHVEDNRPANGLNWTVGAYQQSEAGDPLTEIVWFGGADAWRDGKSEAESQVAWDNRNNWYKMDGTRVTCVDILAEDVKVIIPETNSTKYPHPDGGIQYYPNIPSFDGDNRTEDLERVDAGLGVVKEEEPVVPTKFFESIEIEEGGAIKGVENLYSNGVRHYTEAINHFTAGRKEYILVGTVIKPFADNDKASVRLIQSKDYFIANHEPHVYMRQAQVNGDNVNWNVPFASLEEEVNYDKVFAIMIPNEYGPKKLPAELYYTYRNPNPAMVNDDMNLKTFNFNGWFLNDEVKPVYEVSGNTLLCNTYPANIDIAAAMSENKGSFKVYDYNTFKNFVSRESGEIKSQNGFLFKPGDGNDGSFRITPEMLLNTNTKYKSTTIQNPMFTVMVLNTNGDGGSAAVIKYDELKSDQYVESVDLINTVIDNTPTQPEISIAMYGKELDKVVTPDLTQAIPLKLVCGANMTVEFGSYETLGMEKAVLEDRETGNSYDLLTTKPQISLSKGTYGGRFYLNLGVEEKQDISTDGDDVTSGSASIALYGDGESIIITSSENVILKSAEITDMGGNTTTVKLKNNHYNKIKIKGNQGVYIVKAIGDVKTETAKVIVK